MIEKDNIVVGVTSNDSDHRNVREISARIRETLGTENRNIDRAEKQDSKESEYQRKEMSAGRTGSEEKNSEAGVRNMKNIRVGSRESRLAVVQSEMVMDYIKENCPDI